ncbi:hypothetical protein EES47_16280 [Streptomyces sp. ADI98-12]|nr:hypothetical protein EES47_16280 [Streptomyces sp. ADI98-12]
MRALCASARSEGTGDTSPTRPGSRSVRATARRRDPRGVAEVVRFSHPRGLTRGVVAWADALRTAGHTAHTPDLFEGAPSARWKRAAITPGASAPARSPNAARGRPGTCPGTSSTPARAARPAARPDPAGHAGRAPGPCPCPRPGVRHRPATRRTGAGPRDGGRPASHRGHRAARALVAGHAGTQLFPFPGDQHLFADASPPSDRGGRGDDGAGQRRPPRPRRAGGVGGGLEARSSTTAERARAERLGAGGRGGSLGRPTRAGLSSPGPPGPAPPAVPRRAARSPSPPGVHSRPRPATRDRRRGRGPGRPARRGAV